MHALTQNLLMHSFNKYLFSTFFLPGNILGPWESVVNKTEGKKKKISALMGLY